MISSLRNFFRNSSGTILTISAGFVFIAGAALLFDVLANGWSAYERCANRDVLSWDANLRFLTVMDMRRDLGQGRLIDAVRPIFDSPTWPALRPILSLGLFSIAPGGPDTVLDVAFTYFCFGLLFVSMAILALRLSSTVLHGALVWLAAVVSLLAMNELFAYALSAMLEIQGMLFSVWIVFFLYILYADRFGNRQTAAADGFVSRVTLLGLFLSIQGLYHTKYPYGVMLLIALAALELLRLSYAGIAGVGSLPGRLLFASRGGRIRIIGYVLFAIIAVLTLGGVGFLPESTRPSSKGMRNILFAATLLLFIDFNLAIYRGRELLRETLPVRFRALYWTGLFPAVVWMLVHPDRFQATLGTRDHVQDASRSFSQSLFNEVWLEPELFSILVILAAIFCVLLLFLRLRSSREMPLASGACRALAALILLWALQIAVLELTTPNKQLRHVYHLLPAALVLFAAAAGRLPELVKTIVGSFSEKMQNTKSTALIAAVLSIGLIIGFALLSFPGLQAMARSKDGLHPRPVCFTGTDSDVVEPARQLAADFEPLAGEHVVSMNLLHKLLKPDGSWPPARHIATDIDLLLRMQSYKSGGDLRVDSGRRKDWGAATRLLLIADRCDEDQYRALARTRAGQMNRKIEQEGQLELRDRGVCMTRFRLLNAQESTQND